MSYACGNHCGKVYCSQSCATHDWYVGNHALECVGKSANNKVSKKKAREILHHGSVHGHPLTEQQRRYFGWLANE